MALYVDVARCCCCCSVPAVIVIRSVSSFSVYFVSTVRFHLAFRFQKCWVLLKKKNTKTIVQARLLIDENTAHKCVRFYRIEMGCVAFGPKRRQPLYFYLIVMMIRFDIFYGLD